MAESSEQTKVIGGNAQIVQALQIQHAVGWEDQLCGQYLHGYRLIKKLGQGGMGSVYMAEQVNLRRIVALKMLNPLLAKNRDFLNRFISEAKAAAAINHRNLVQIYDVGESNGVYYFSMEMVDGENVGQVLDRSQVIPHRISLEIIIPVVAALSAAHARGVVHRDVKPDNIMLSVEGIPKLADLGIAKVQDADHRRTESGAQLGTPHYVSPEQARNPGAVDVRADIYSLGATMFHMVTGRPPYEGANVATILQKLSTEPVPVASEINSAVPYPLSSVLQRMMAKMPHERYSGAEELYQVLIELRGQFSTQAGAATARHTLVAGEQVRIEATDESPEMELKLEGEEEEEQDELYRNYVPKVSRPGKAADAEVYAAPIDDPDQFVPAVLRPSGPRPSAAELQSAAAAAAPAAAGPPPRPNRPGRPGRPSRPGSSQAPAQAAPSPAIIGGVVVLVVAVVGVILFGRGGSSSSEEPGPREVAETPVSSTRASEEPVSLSPTVDEDEEAAKAIWARWKTKPASSLEMDQLDACEQDLERLLGRFPDTITAAAAAPRLRVVRKERERRRVSDLRAKSKQHEDAGELQKAIDVLQAFIEANPEHPERRSLEDDVKQLEKKVEKAYRALLAESDALAAKHDYDEAGARLVAGVKQLGPARVKQAAQQVERYQQAKLQRKRTLELLRYPAYYAEVKKGLRAGDKYTFAAGVAAAERGYVGEVATLHPRETELAEIRGVKAAYDSIGAHFEELAEKGVEVEVYLRGKKRPKKGKVTSRKLDKVMLTTAITYISKLQPRSLLEHGGEVLKGELGKLRLALLLQALGHDDEAEELLRAAKLEDDAVLRRYWLRFIPTDLVSALDALEAVSGTEGTSDALSRVYAKLAWFKGSPYEKPASALLAKAIREGLGKVRSTDMIRYAERLARNPKPEVRASALRICRVVIEFVDDPRAKDDVVKAEALAKSLER